MRPLLTPLIVIVALATIANFTYAEEDPFNAHGQIRLLVEQHHSNEQSMLTELANWSTPSTLSNSTNRPLVQVDNELNLQGKHWYATLSARANRASDAQWSEQVQLNQAYWSQEFGPWQFHVGRKLVSWDVGYAYRPNDMVQREQRRNLYASTLTGKDMMSADWFSATQALSLIAWRTASATPQDSASAYALRYYQRLPSADWYGFARYSGKQGWSLGSAISQVLSDALEIHASLRLNQRNRVLRDHSQQLINQSSPWQEQTRDLTSQFLLGTTYTNEAQHSFYFEYWYDQLALDRTEWRVWQQRQTALRQALKQQSFPVAALLGQFSWQTQAFNQSDNLRQHNLFARWSQQHEAWQYSADVLWYPEDRGRILTLGASWQGDKTKFEIGLRRYAGPNQAVTRQLSDQSKGFINVSWAY